MEGKQGPSFSLGMTINGEGWRILAHPCLAVLVVPCTAMTNNQTQAVLRTAFEHLRAQRVALSALLAEVGAIRHSLIELGPEYKMVMERHRQKHINETRDLVYEDLEKLQKVIDTLNGG